MLCVACLLERDVKGNDIDFHFFFGNKIIIFKMLYFTWGTLNMYRITGSIFESKKVKRCHLKSLVTTAIIFKSLNRRFLRKFFVLLKNIKLQSLILTCGQNSWPKKHLELIKKKKHISFEQKRLVLYFSFLICFSSISLSLSLSLVC